MNYYKRPYEYYRRPFRNNQIYGGSTPTPYSLDEIRQLYPGYRILILRPGTWMSYYLDPPLITMNEQHEVLDVYHDQTKYDFGSDDLIQKDMNILKVQPSQIHFNGFYRNPDGLTVTLVD